MPFPILSRADVETQTLAEFQARIPGADTVAPKSTLAILAKVVSYPVWAANRFLLWVLKQAFTSTAEAPYLDTGLADYGVIRENSTPSTGKVIFTNVSGAAITVFGATGVQTSDTTVSYVTTAAVTVPAGGTASVAVQALGGGSATNQPAGTVLNLSVAIAGIAPTVTVDSNGLTGGADQETDDALRIRGIARKSQPPQGGAATDYVAWAKLVAGVTRAWVYPLGSGFGTVNVLFVMDARPDNIPLSGDITNVAAAIAPLRPVTALVTVLAPVPDALTIAITGMMPNTAAIQAAVVAQLASLALTVIPGGASAGDGLPSGTAGKLYLAQINAAILAGGANVFDLTAPTSDVTFATGHLPGVPTVSFA